MEGEEVNYELRIMNRQISEANYFRITDDCLLTYALHLIPYALF
jgi:hypothetical protein